MDELSFPILYVAFLIDVELIVPLEILSKALFEAVGGVGLICNEDVLACFWMDAIEDKAFPDVLNFLLILLVRLFPEPVLSIRIVIIDVVIADGYSDACLGAVLAESIEPAAFELAGVFAHRLIAFGLALDLNLFVHLHDKRIVHKVVIVDIVDSQPN